MEYLEGHKVEGNYMGKAVTGVVRESRIRYSEMIHYVDLDEKIEVFGRIRDGVILKSSDVTKVVIEEV